MPVFPVPVFKGLIPKVSSPFGPRGDSTHRGSDIMYRRPSTGTQSLPVFSKNYQMPGGIPALAFESGIVTRSGTMRTGGRVEIDHGRGFSTKYFHMRKLRVKVGDRVSAGDPVGDISHNAVGYRLNHLHFETLINGRQVDPETFLQKAQIVDVPSVPSELGFLVNVGIAVGVGLLLNKYVFK